MEKPSVSSSKPQIPKAWFEHWERSAVGPCICMAWNSFPLGCRIRQLRRNRCPSPTSFAHPPICSTISSRLPLFVFRLEMKSDLSCDRARRHVVRAAECGEKVVKHIVVGQIDHRETGYRRRPRGQKDFAIGRERGCYRRSVYSPPALLGAWTRTARRGKHRLRRWRLKADRPDSPRSGVPRARRYR